MYFILDGITGLFSLVALFFAWRNTIHFIMMKVESAGAIHLLIDMTLHIFLPLIISILAMYSFLVLTSYDICQHHVYMACRINVALTESSAFPILGIVRVVTLLSCAFGCFAIAFYLVSQIIDEIHGLVLKTNKRANAKYLFLYILALIAVSVMFIYVMYGFFNQ